MALREPPGRMPVSGPDLERLLNTVPARVWRLDVAHRVVWANCQAAALVARDADTIIGFGLRDLFVGAPPDMAEREAVCTGIASQWRGWSDYADGRRRFTERHFMPDTDETGAVVGYFEFTTDQTDLMAAREGERRAEQMLRGAVQNLPDAVGIQDGDGRLRICNDAYSRLYGVPEEELVGTLFHERFPKLRSKLVAINETRFDSNDADQWQRLRETASNTVHPLTFRFDNGTEFLVKRALTDGGGRVVVFTDITALKAQAREVSASRALLEDAMEAIGLGVAIFDAEGRLMLRNGGFAALFAPREIEEGMTWTDILGQSPEPRLSRARRARLSIDDDEATILLENGRRIAVSTKANRGGSTVLTARDVTDSHAAEIALRDSWETVMSVLEACPAPVTMARLEDSRIVYFNPAARQVLRLDEIAPDDAHFRSMWTDLGERERFLSTLRREGRIDGFEHRFRRADGTHVWLGLWSRLAEFRGEAVSVSIATDLSERREQEDEQARLRESAQQAEKLAALGEVLAGISHELNNPLSVLVGQAAILRETAPDSSTRRRAERISEAADRCARIVRSFLSMAREEPIDAVTLDVGDLAREALEIAEPEVSRAEVTASLDLAPTPGYVLGDREQLRQVVVNLLTNAAQAMRGRDAPREITVITRIVPEGDVVRLSVVDTGPGIPPVIAKRIFQPFFTTKTGTSAGIGLALSLRIIVAHGGRIEVSRGSPAGGARFMIELPRTGAPEPTPCEKRAAADLLTVLVVDDDRIVLRNTAELMEFEGFRAVCAASVEEALELLRELDPDAIISDIRMPGRDGFSFFRQIQAERPALAERFVFATGQALSADIYERLRRLGRPYLEKPFLPGDVRGILGQIVPKKPSE